MKLNRSGYYKWRSRKGTKNSYERTREVLYELIRTAHSRFPTRGYRALNSIIRRETGWIVSDGFVHACCRYLGVKSKAKHCQKRKTGTEHTVYKNEVRGNWNATKPMEIVVSDMTCLYHKGKRLEWTYMLDTFHHEILCSHVSWKENDPKPYYRCLQDLLKKMKEQTAPLVLHTDQGAVYSSKAFSEAHKDYNIIRSMSRSATPTDNPIIEAHNGWMNEELCLDFKFKQCEDPELLIKEYVQYFNHERPAYALKYKTPVEFRLEQGFR